MGGRGGPDVKAVRYSAIILSHRLWEKCARGTAFGEMYNWMKEELAAAVCKPLLGIANRFLKMYHSVYA